MPHHRPPPSPRRATRPGPLLRRPWAAPVLAVVVAVLLSACYAVQPRGETPERKDVSSVPAEGVSLADGGDLVMGLSADPDVLDPTTSSSLYTRYVMSSICEKLYDIDAQGRIVPQLATELPELDDGGRTVRIPLRQGVTFADGTPFDAEAVQRTLERHLEKEDSARAAEMGPVESVVAVDDSTVELRYATPFAPVTASLADRAGMILSPRALDDLGDDFGTSPVCVGPFRFVERVPATSIVVERDPEYYAADEVHLDTITYRIMTDANIRAANLQSGDVHVIDTVSPTTIETLEREPGIGLLQTGSLGYQGITFNLGNTDGVGTPPGTIDTPVASDPRVRAAFELSLDREALVNSVFDNWFEPACSPISPDTVYATEASNECPPFDPERARDLLDEAGVDTPVELTMKVSNTPDTLRLAQAIQGSVSAGGFDIELEPVEYTTLLDDQTGGDFEILQLGWSGRIDPHGNMFSFLSTGQANNYSGFSDERVDALLERAAGEVDTGRRADLYGQVVTLVHEVDPIVYLYRQRNLTGYSEDVAGVSTYGDGVVRLSRAAFVTDGGS
ncbi:ABC transporter substrate-binding protein [Nocardioides sp. zg-1228]|uniref:ABC transporter substrate-binding protein n=1 Tax=Nocardioides sp. zg-1228 TaxID=2763008 RepID=UPI001643487D|nr:ABC transporter substrate-binding protein [Nocardioides sp. zg-1228]MBC2934634.1 ABC transporter substrate-binding protein [Nocardioides sp. zg-1228]QSF59380.1 ABC transporter substrate-binding protein [Nocardioides sp. zg-1228]